MNHKSKRHVREITTKRLDRKKQLKRTVLNHYQLIKENDSACTSAKKLKCTMKYL